MINHIIDGISIKLNQVFGDSYEIYSEDIKQGFKEPCFFIVPLLATSTSLLGVRSKRNHAFDIHFFPSSSEPNREINDISALLIDEMELITVDGYLVRGTKMSTETVNGVLHFFVNYNMVMLKDMLKENEMEQISFGNGLR
ncbi:phage tail terminator family protein [Peribacillus loiseleuriae]|uniref:Phage protein n=1 Tax=Peribacillus loiseleuriae TaxID=1679170 RepID=A0A0K9GSH6_9BACI|nr:hypothetical protein [Peribacillus loiseleuriae]KMY49232.1 hypothetical protein AC625_06600 [Peribacillus loiseleuriae]